MKKTQESISILKKKIRILCQIAADLRCDGQVSCPMLPWDPKTGTDTSKCSNDCPRCFSEYANGLLGIKVNW